MRHVTAGEWSGGPAALTGGPAPVELYEAHYEELTHSEYLIVHYEI